MIDFHVLLSTLTSLNSHEQKEIHAFPIPSHGLTPENIRPRKKFTMAVNKARAEKVRNKETKATRIPVA